MSQATFQKKKAIGYIRSKCYHIDLNIDTLVSFASIVVGYVLHNHPVVANNTGVQQQYCLQLLDYFIHAWGFERQDLLLVYSGQKEFLVWYLIHYSDTKITFRCNGKTSPPRTQKIYEQSLKFSLSLIQNLNVLVQRIVEEIAAQGYHIQNGQIENTVHHSLRCYMIDFFREGLQHEWNKPPYLKYVSSLVRFLLETRSVMQTKACCMIM